MPLEWFTLSAGAKISMDSGTENMDWIARGAAPHRRVHAGRRRDQRRGQRHQRRRPALLERRGHHADAHARHPGDDAGGGDGAHRQAGARLLGQRLRRGQPGHRRLRPHHGPERPGAVLGPRRRRRLLDPAPPLRAHLRRPRRALPAPRPRPAIPVDRDVCAFPHGNDGEGFALVGDVLERRDEPRTQEAVRHPRGDGRVRRPGPPRCSSAGRRGATPRRASCGTPTSGASRCASSASSRIPCPGSASPPPTGPSTGPRARSSRSPRRRSRAPSTRRAATARSSSSPTSPASTAPRVDAPSAARVRCRDRPRGGELRGPHRVLRRLALPRRRLRRLLEGPQR